MWFGAHRCNIRAYLLTREEALRQNVNINLCKHLKSDDKDGNCFILSEENNIVITQKDIRNVQLAKGAIQAGCEILLKKAGIGLNDINSIMLFGLAVNLIRTRPPGEVSS